MHWAKDAVVYTFHNMKKPVCKVVFSSLEDFIDDALDLGLSVVRLDTFDEVRQSELSFVNYVTSTLYVTAFHTAGNMVLEYTEMLGAGVTTERGLTDKALLTTVQERTHATEQGLIRAGLKVRRGRYTSDSPALH